MKTDEDIKRDVEAELRWAPNVDETDMAIRVNSGVVTLSGFARSYIDRHAAENAVKRVSGVSAVANDLVVRLPSIDEIPDPELARNIVAALRFEMPAAHEHLQALVNDGHVTLEGTVEWGFLKDQAERVVHPLRGVKGVTNQITIRPRVAPSEIKRKIQSALLRSAQLDSNAIQVESREGAVILRGKVRSWSERQEAQETAWAAPGVTSVTNNITVSVY
jgi:osmotically-inducible protein OsmY